MCPLWIPGTACSLNGFSLWYICIMELGYWFLLLLFWWFIYCYSCIYVWFKEGSKILFFELALDLGLAYNYNWYCSSIHYSANSIFVEYELFWAREFWGFADGRNLKPTMSTQAEVEKSKSISNDGFAY